MKTFISVVSHGHLSILKTINTLPSLVKLSDVFVVVRDNLGEPGLQSWCAENDIDYVVNNERFGFARNNNLNFEWLHQTYAVSDDDIFLILNPDVFISQADFKKFSEFMYLGNYELTSILQYKDEGRVLVEPSARHFSGPISLLLERFLFGRRTLIPNSGLESTFDWTSGAFIGVRCCIYEEVGGFCERYFMYYEDADFFLRCKRLGYKLTINTDISAIHYAQYGNRKVFSRLFFFSFRSYIRFLVRYTYYIMKDINPI